MSSANLSHGGVVGPAEHVPAFTLADWELCERELPQGSVQPSRVLSKNLFVFVRSGCVLWMLGGTLRRAVAGDMVFIPAGVSHGFRVLEPQPLRMWELHPRE